MAATVKGSAASAAATSVALPAHAAGDVIVMFAFRDGSTTPPTVPTAGGTVPTWNIIDRPTGGNSSSLAACWARATATNHTSGTWTNATGVAAVVIQGASGTNPPIGGHIQAGGTTQTTATCGALTQSNTDGSSCLLEFYAHRYVTAWAAAPTGYSRLTSVATELCLNAKTTTTADGDIGQSLTTSGNGGYRGENLEVLALAVVPVTLTCAPSSGTATGGTIPGLTVAVTVVCAANTATAGGTIPGLTVAVTVVCAANTATAGGQNVLPSSFLGAATGQASGTATVRIPAPLACSAATASPVSTLRLGSATVLGSSTRLGARPMTLAAGTPTPATLPCGAGSATGSGRSVLLSLFPDASHAVASTVGALSVPGLGLRCAAATAAVTSGGGTMRLGATLILGPTTKLGIVPVVLQTRSVLSCSASSATATGRSVLLGMFLNACWATASTTAKVTETTWLPMSPSAAQASGQDVLLGMFLDAGAAAATGSVEITVPQGLALTASSAVVTSLLISLGVPPTAPLTLFASSSQASGTLSLSRAEPIVPAACSATAAGQVTMSSWLDAATATSGSTLDALYAPPALVCAPADIAASATAELAVPWYWEATATSTGQSMMLGWFLDPASATASGRAAVGVRFELVAAGRIFRPTIGRVRGGHNGRIENRLDRDVLRHHV